MKKIGILFVILLASINLNAQKFKQVDKSPLDVVMLKESRNSLPVIKVYYSRPHKKGRELFGALVPFNKIWRLGANEATEIIFNSDVTFGAQKIGKGIYTMYAIPSETEWEIIISKKLDTWGAYSYDESLDVARIKTKVKIHPTEVEAFSMKFTKINKKKESSLWMAWGTTKVRIPIKL